MVKNLVLGLYRVRIIMLGLAVIVLVGLALFDGLLPVATDPGQRMLGLIALAGLVIGGALALIGPRYLPTPVTRRVAPPVTGRWLALNSPASKIPSHGIRAYGQTYAIDLVAEPPDQTRPAFGTGRAMRDATQYPAFGQPVYTMVSGTVVRTTDWRRDHRARSNTWGLGYLMVEGAIRELGGPGFIFGNHVIIRIRDDLFALVAHLQHNSITVEPGETVCVGEQLGRCGNSGNSSEPHVHAQLMDRKSLLRAIGVPMVFRSVLSEDGTTLNGLPKNGQHIRADR